MRTLRLISLLLFTLLGATLFAEEQPPHVQRLIEAAEQAGSDALYVSVDGAPVVDWSRGERKPIELMSTLKSVVAIAIGRLLLDGDLESLDQPVHTFYPEWKQGRKKLITVRHLLNHTSGLQNVPNAGAEIYPSPNAIQLALAAELTADPGAAFSYNNKAVNLLAGIIEKASGLRMDLYFGEKLFAPMRITEHQWYFDKSGQPHAMAGLRLLAADAAKFGEIIVDGGTYGETRLVSQAYVTEMLAPGQQMHPLAGLLWWRYVPEQTITPRNPLPQTGDAAMQDHLRALAGTQYTSRGEARNAVEAKLGADHDQLLTKALGPDWFGAVFDWRVGEAAAYYAQGSLGQYIVVVPEAKVVAVRQIATRAGLSRQTMFSDFTAEVVAFARSMAKVP